MTHGFHFIDDYQIETTQNNFAVQYEHTHTLFFFVRAGIQGSQLETVVADDASIGDFVRNWVSAASEAAGVIVRTQASLESLESQQTLIDMLADSSQGLAQSRKQLTALGAMPTVESVRNILQNEHWQQSIHFAFLHFPIVATHAQTHTLNEICLHA